MYNQIGAVNIMINYITKHQNSPAFFYLFRENFVKMIHIGGLNVSSLLNSKIFYSRIDFDGWPLVSEIDEEICVPYNGNLYTIRDNYQQVWKDHAEVLQECTTNEHHQITYKLNLLPGVLMDENNELMQVIGNIEDQFGNMDIFNCQAL